MAHAGEHQVTQRPLDAEPIEPLLLHLSIAISAVAQLGGGFADLACLPRRSRERTVQHDIRGAIISLDMRRRERKLGADPLITVPQGVFV